MKPVTVEFDVAITNDLQIGFFARGEVTPEQAKIALQKLVKALETENITLGEILPIERHTDDTRLQAVHDLTHLHNHDH